MITTVSLAAQHRDTGGKGPARQMRMVGRIPAVVYGRGRDPESLSVSAAEVDKLLATHARASTIISLAIDGDSVKVLIRDVQRHPLRRDITHLDFYEIHEGESITVTVPIHLEGSPDGVRNAGGTLDQVLREVQIAVLPRHIPERLELEVTALTIGQSLHVRDLVIENANILTDGEMTICSVIPPRVEEEVAPVEGAVEEEELEDESAEPELIRKPKGEEEDEGPKAEG
ncbi:MAG: 50S ribosomal protein L25 [Gemmatimonadetes bacterium]|nr:50S ribosomal protein L25 [Gemmatimonadota bacterium]